jgi:hypothetical protein
VIAQSPHLEDFAQNHQHAACEIRRLFGGHLQKPLAEGRDALGAHVVFHRLQDQGHEHGRLGGARELRVEQDSVEGSVEAVRDGVARDHELVEQEEGLGCRVEGGRVDDPEEVGRVLLDEGLDLVGVHKGEGAPHAGEKPAQEPGVQLEVPCKHRATPRLARRRSASLMLALPLVASRGSATMSRP